MHLLANNCTHCKFTLFVKRLSNDFNSHYNHITVLIKLCVNNYLIQIVFLIFLILTCRRPYHKYMTVFPRNSKHLYSCPGTQILEDMLRGSQRLTSLNYIWHLAIFCSSLPYNIRIMLRKQYYVYNINSSYTILLEWGG